MLYTCMHTEKPTTKIYVEIATSQNALELPPENYENQIPFSTDQDSEI